MIVRDEDLPMRLLLAVRPPTRIPERALAALRSGKGAPRSNGTKNPTGNAHIFCFTYLCPYADHLALQTLGSYSRAQRW
jgi:hypothetical protein